MSLTGVGQGGEGKTPNGSMINNTGRRNGVAHRLTIIGKWWVASIAIVFVVGTAFALVISLFRLLVGNPEWEGIVMLPIVFILVVMLCLPGAGLFAVGKLLGRRSS